MPDHFFLPLPICWRNLRYWDTVMVPVLPLVLLPPSGVAGALVTDFLPVLEDLPAAFFPLWRVSTAEAPLPAALAVAFLAEAFLPLTVAAAAVVAFLALPPPRETTLVLPSLIYHSPHELAMIPWETWPLPPVMGAMSTFLEAAAAQT